jgi:hypothetical protein
VAEITVGSETFTLRRVASTRLLRFASLAARGVGEHDMEALAAIDELFSKAVQPEDRERFEAACDEVALDFRALMEIVAEIMRDATNLPTAEPSDSSSGPLSTSDASAAGSSSAVIARMEEQGRPSIAYMVQQADRARLSLVSA